MSARLGTTMYDPYSGVGGGVAGGLGIRGTTSAAAATFSGRYLGDYDDNDDDDDVGPFHNRRRNNHSLTGTADYGFLSSKARPLTNGRGSFTRGTDFGDYNLASSDWVDRLLSTGGRLETRPSSSDLLTCSAGRRKYVFCPEPDDAPGTAWLSKPRSSLYVGAPDRAGTPLTLLSGGFSTASSHLGSKDASQASRPGMIGSTPAYDRFGKELSNYERWKLAQGFRQVGGSAARDTAGAAAAPYREVDILRPLKEASASPEKDPKEDAYSGSRFLRRVRAAAAAGDEVDNGEAIGPDKRLASSSMSSNSSSRWTIPSGDPAGVDGLTITGSRFTGRSEAPAGSADRQPRSSGPASLRWSSTSSPLSSTSAHVHTFPSDVRSKLVGYDVQDVTGDGGCYYRCLSLYFTGSQSNYNTYRREVMSYIRDNLDNYSSMIKSEVGYASTSDYFSRKTRSDRQEFAETTEIIATCCRYNINVHVLALVPGSRRSWEWLHFDPSIGSGRPSAASGDVYLYNQGSVHFMLCTPKR